VYDGAIYLHQGRSYQCTSLDLKERIACVRPVRGTKYYTSVGGGKEGEGRTTRRLHAPALSEAADSLRLCLINKRRASARRWAPYSSSSAPPMSQ
jgi:ATP-dependent helicase YprA (DUF1998 family)